SVDNEIIEAARLDTGSTWKILLHIIIPAIRPGIICAWVMVFTEQWNAVAEPLVLLETETQYPLAVMLNNIEAGDVLGFTATVLFLLAPLLLFIYFESEIIEGLGEYRLK
ncbi:MAG: ABC transporter permease subunit, partial [Clostridia bacterium]|nr:ABC transporter permease subunit [Clostridia bacterium]